VQNDAAQVNYAQVQLGFTTITSPITGRVGARLVDAGNIVHAADTGGLLVVNQIDPIALQFTLPQEQFQAVNRAINTGRVLTVQAQDQSSRELLATGALTLVNNQIDTTTGTITLKAYFANPEHKLWPGQTAMARLILGMVPQAVVVPNAALQRATTACLPMWSTPATKRRCSPWWPVAARPDSR
jgi:multidrug efflux system membrane fusion protein